MSITKKFKVKDMHCTNCERIIEKRVRSLEGVENIKVSYVSEAGEVKFDPEKVDFQMPNIFIVTYNTDRLNKEQILNIDIFKNYPAKEIR